MSNSSTLSSSLSLSASRKPRTNFCEFTWWWWRWRWRWRWRWCWSPSALCQSPHTAPPLGQRPPLCGEGIFLRGKNQHTNHPDHLANPTTQTTPTNSTALSVFSQYLWFRVSQARTRTRLELNSFAWFDSAMKPKILSKKRVKKLRIWGEKGIKNLKFWGKRFLKYWILIGICGSTWKSRAIFSTLADQENPTTVWGS